MQENMTENTAVETLPDESAGISESVENERLGEETQGDISQTKKYSERLNKDRAKIRQEYENELNSYENMQNALRELGYEGENPDELIESMRSEVQKRNSEDLRAQEAIVQRALDIALMHKRMKDLEAIKAVYPECEETDSMNIGEVFINLMQTGKVDALTAYEAQMAYNKRNAVEKVESMGKAASRGVNIQKDYYTPEESQRFTRKDYERNPGLWEKVRNSMLRW